MQPKQFVYLLLLILFPVFLNAQKNIITGKITDASNGEVLTGATISIKKTSLTSLSDIDGKYVFKNLDNGMYDLEISFVGYTSKEVTGIELKSGKEEIINITLQRKKENTLNEVSVVTDARKESLNTLLNIRRNAPVVSDAISADMIRRSPDRNISDVLKRVSGTTVQDNKFVVVRGMNDRYNEATLNGALLPSTEPDRKTFSFDIFPSDVVDNVTIIKSALPEYPASFSGGLIQVNLKEIPDKNFFSIRAGVGINTITTGNNYYRSYLGNLDFLGIDDRTRAIPYSFPDQEKYNKLSLRGRDKYASAFPNDWKLVKDNSAPLNTILQMSGGFNHVFKNGYSKLGGVFGLSYYSNYRFSKSIVRDYGYATIISDDSVDTGPAFYNFTDSTYKHTILESLLANFSFKLNANNKLFYNNLLAINSTSLTAIRNGRAPSLIGGDFDNSYYGYAHYFQSNTIYNTQIGGEHLLPKLKLKIKWLGFYTKFHRNEPDYRQMIYYKPSESDPYYAYISSPTLFTTITGGLRLYFKTKDDGKGTNVDFNKSFTLFKQRQSFKFGGFYYFDNRTRDGRFLRNDIPNFNAQLLTLPPDKIFANRNFDVRSGFVITDFARPDWIYYAGNIKQMAAYAMLDNKLTEKLRLAWGFRYESYKNKVSSYLPNEVAPTIFDTTFKDLLPSANFIYSVLPKANIRLSYSHTVARPLYRELARTLYYDFFQNATFTGNSLSETKIDNYEIRWEQYFPDAQYYSVSGFYKNFKNPIEPKIVIRGADSKTITWVNVPSAECFGLEAEVRKNLGFIAGALSDLYIYTNASLIKSTAFVKGNGSDTANRPLQGQSPYIVNAALQYAGKNNGLIINLQYNIIGERIAFIGDVQNPYVWEKPHPVLDFKVSKVFLKNAMIELSLSDLLHKNDVFFWDVDNNKKYNKNYPDVLIQSRSFGMTGTLTFSYRLP